MYGNVWANNNTLSATPVECAIKDYLTALRRRRYSPKSIDTYGRALMDFASFLSAAHIDRPHDVEAETIENYRLNMRERDFLPNSQEVFLRAVRNLFNWLEKSGRLFANPCRDLVVRQCRGKLPAVPSEEDIRKLLAVPDVAATKGLRDRAIIEVAYSTGARREELCRMSIFDVDSAAGTVRIHGKGNRERVVPLGRRAAHWLEHYLKHARPRLLAAHIDQEALWLGNRGRALSGQAMHVRVRKYANAVGIKPRITLHSLRRACATHMLRRGAHPVQIQMLLGHASMQHLSQYLRLSIREIKAMHAKAKPGK